MCHAAAIANDIKTFMLSGSSTSTYVVELSHTVKRVASFAVPGAILSRDDISIMPSKIRALENKA
ncbi:MAG: hypothetical protein ACLUV8_14130 [Clostridium sp.]